jgi:hypothetical protein
VLLVYSRLYVSGTYRLSEVGYLDESRLSLPKHELLWDDLDACFMHGHLLYIARQSDDARPAKLWIRSFLCTINITKIN